MTGDPLPPEALPPKKPKGRSFLRDGVRVLMSQGVHIFLNIFTGIVTVAIWGDAVLGQIRVAQVATRFAGVIGDLGMGKALPVEIGRDGQDPKHIVRVVMSLWLISSIVITSLAAVPFLIPGMFNTTWWWGVLAAATIPTTLLRNYTRGVALGLDKIKVFSSLGWNQDLIVLLTVIGLGWFAGMNAPDEGWVRILAALVATLMIGLYCARFLFINASIGFDRDWPVMRRILKRGVLFASGGVLMRLNYQVDVVLLGLTVYAIDPGQIGQYTLGASLATFVWQVPIGLGFVVIARGVRTKDPVGFARKNARLVRLAVFVSVFAGAGICAVAPHLLPLVYRNIQGQNVIHEYVWILTPGVVAFIAARLFESDLVARNKPLLINAVMGPVVLANIALNLYLIPQSYYFSGARGAALASTITYTLGAMGMTVVYARATGLSVREIVTPTLDDARALAAPIRKLIKR